jgi:predicted regulator of Ras-like GTPase activity (Roadblock/LC7/MglB family)
MGIDKMNRQNRRLMLLFSLILVVIPMVIFPSRLGLPLLNGSAMYMLYEVVFYGVILFLFRREASLSTLLAGSALCLVYRLTLGAVFSLTIIVMYSLNLLLAFSLGMAKYMPAVLLHVIATPFVMKRYYVRMADDLSPERRRRRSAETGSYTPAPHREEALVQGRRLDERMKPTIIGARPMEPMRPQPSVGDDENQFEKAVTYMGEAASVKLVVLTDEEGLPLSRFSRGDEDVELWGPLAIVLEGHNRRVLNQYKRGGDPEKIDITTRNGRILVRRIEHVILVVLAEHDADETLLIRIAQAADMIRKYMSERYSPALFARVEERYVSNS